MEFDRRWQPLGESLALSADELHVWSACLDLDQGSVSNLRGLLSRDELDRAERYRSGVDRRRFIVARALLRLILGRYLGMSPERLRFRCGPYGKPSLAIEQGKWGVEFSVSHSSGMVVYAVGRGRRIGIDLEQVRDMPDLGRLVERYFATSEQAEFQALSPQQRLEGFYRCWTRKEAFVKAEGRGLAFALDQFEVSLTPGEPARLLKVNGNPQEASLWRLFDLQPAEGFVGAAAAEGHNLHITGWQWIE